MSAGPRSGVELARVCTLPGMRIALTFAAALLATACGDDGTLTTETTNPSSPMTTSSASAGDTGGTDTGTPTSGDAEETGATTVDLDPDNLMERYGAPCTVDAVTAG